MALQINHPDMNAQLGRSLIAVHAGCADLGEIDQAVNQITPGNNDHWHNAWAALAKRTEQRGRDLASEGHTTSAGQYLLRASEYWRQAFFYHRDDLDNPQLKTGFAHHRNCFRRACDHLPWHSQFITLTPEQTALRAPMNAVLMQPDSSQTPRPTIIAPCGFDSTMESGYSLTGYMALQRGMNFFSFEGPGQGAMLYEHGLPMGPDFEHAARPAIDWLATQTGVDRDALIMVGRSLGGYLGARAAAFDTRLRLLVCDPGQYDFSEAFISERLDRDTWQQIQAANPEVESALQKLLADPEQRRFFAPRMATLGAKTVGEYMRRQARFSLTECIEQIQMPVLVLDSAGDFASQSETFYQALSAPKTRAPLGPDDGVTGHCGGLGAKVVEAVMFDWIEQQLGTISH